MKTFRSYISEINGLRFIYEELEINSSAGRNKLLKTEMLVKEFELKVNFANLNETYNFIKEENNKDIVSQICMFLNEMNDISSSINNLYFNRVSDDIELFEIKKFSLISQKIKKLLDKSGFFVILFHDLNEVVEILDPQNTGIPSFYIYSDYDTELAQLRKQKDNSDNPAKEEEIRIKCIEIEDKIRKDLSKKIAKHVKNLEYNINRLADLDILIAKAKLAIKFGMCEPIISNQTSSYSGIFNPQIRVVLENKNKKFQAVDIEINNHPTLITGANMSGKSVLLRTVALCQFMFQFGFFIPAKKAIICPVDEVLISIGDNQNELNGLSSFAIEMLNINRVITQAKDGIKILALIDEPARTTNPDEGKAIVNALIEILNELNVSALVSTHYSGIITKKRLRVKGLRDISDNENVNIENINDFMDYTLVEIDNDKVPSEAIRIAEILGIDKDLIMKAKNYIQ